MLSFFTILFIILGANAVFMIFSLNGVSQKEPKTDKDVGDSSPSQVFPMDLGSSKFKKAV